MKIEAPIIVVGMGGSGTRVPTEILGQMGVYMGKDLNESLDNLTFSFLFQRPEWYVNAVQHDHEQIGIGFEAFLGANFGPLKSRSATCLDFALKAFGDELHTFPEEWRQERLQRTMELSGPLFETVEFWGWKLPQNDIFLNYYDQLFPEMKLIYLQRHGLDMAFTKSFDCDQARIWGPILYGIPHCSEAELPLANLKYWIWSYRKATEIGSRIGPERFLSIRFEELCQSPIEKAEQIAAFIGKNFSADELGTFCRGVKTPGSTGRYKEQDLSIFSEEDLAVVEEAGYVI